MIKALRRKFILTSMALVTLVLLAVFALQTFTAYQQARMQVLRALDEAILQPRELPFPGGAQEFPDPDKEPRPIQAVEPRILFTVPHFSIEVDEEGQVTGIQAGPGVEVDQETAQALADTVLASTEEQGTLPGQGLSYLYRYDSENDRRVLAFADYSSVGETVRRQLLTSLLILLPTLLAFWLVSRFLARWSLKPVEEAWERERQFVADASHELKTPITVILANTDIVLSHPEDTVSGQAKWLDYTRDEAERMKSLVNDLLFLAKNDAAQAPLHPVPVELSDLVTGSLMSFESVAFESGVTLDDCVEPGLSVWGDPAQLRRLAVILLDNAVKYAGAGGRVTVSLVGDPDRIRLSVRNTGAPIPAEHLPHLFERFYRSDAARDRQQGGYGLGLAIAKVIADAHGGEIGVTSSADEGTVFTVSLPRNRAK